MFVEGQNRSTRCIDVFLQEADMIVGGKEAKRQQQWPELEEEELS